MRMGSTSTVGLLDEENSKPVCSYLHPSFVVGMSIDVSQD